MISNTVIASNVGAMGLSYDVRVRGTVSGLPIDFGFHAEYTFAPLDNGGCCIHRRVQDLIVHRLACILGGTIKSNLRKALAKENATMGELLSPELEAVVRDA